MNRIELKTRKKRENETWKIFILKCHSSARWKNTNKDSTTQPNRNEFCGFLSLDFFPSIYLHINSLQLRKMRTIFIFPFRFGFAFVAFSHFQFLLLTFTSELDIGKKFGFFARLRFIQKKHTFLFYRALFYRFEGFFLFSSGIITTNASSRAASSSSMACMQCYFILLIFLSQSYSNTRKWNIEVFRKNFSKPISFV